MSISLSIIIIAYTFYILSVVVDKLFVPALDVISKKLKLSPNVAGATLMAAGTSAPELSTTLFALFLTGANPATGVGTVVGSAIFQILVVIGFAAVVKTSYLNWKPVIRDGVFYAASVGLLIFVLRDNTITLTEAILLVTTYLIYLGTLVFWTKFVDESDEPDPIELMEEGIDDVEKDIQKQTKKNTLIKVLNLLVLPIDAIVDAMPQPGKNKYATPLLFFGSLATIAASSYLLVVHAENLAVAFGIPPAIIALTILAGGSSIPEMVGSAVVAKQGRGDMAISNAIGSNIFDIQISLGLPLLLYTIANGTLTNVGGENITSSALLLFATLVMVLALLAAQKFKATRPFGLLLIGTYVLYVAAAYAGWL